MGVDLAPTPSIEEQDLLQRSTKKHKQRLEGEPELDSSGTCAGEQTHTSWSRKLFTDTVKQRPANLEIYTCEDLAEVAKICNLVVSEERKKEDTRHRFTLSLEKYRSLFKPLWGALILKLLGKSLPLRIMEQRTRELWKF